MALFFNDILSCCSVLTDETDASSFASDSGLFYMKQGESRIVYFAIMEPNTPTPDIISEEFFSAFLVESI